MAQSKAGLQKEKPKTASKNDWPKDNIREKELKVIMKESKGDSRTGEVLEDESILGEKEVHK